MLCQNCNKHEATVKWRGMGGALSFVTSDMEWCECCAVKAQLEDAKEMAARIPELEAELATACKEAE